MRDYSNIPVIKWGDELAPYKAKAQILHQEPVILQMPITFQINIEDDEFGCELDQDSGILYGCDGGELLIKIARQTHLDGLDVIADACVQSSSRVDIDREKQRIIVHD